MKQSYFPKKVNSNDYYEHYSSHHEILIVENLNIFLYLRVIIGMTQMKLQKIDAVCVSYTPTSLVDYVYLLSLEQFLDKQIMTKKKISEVNMTQLSKLT